MQNISWKYLKLILGILSICGYMINSSWGQEVLPDTSVAPVIPDTVKYKVRPFNPGYFKDENQKHLAFHFKINKDGELKINKEKQAKRQYP